MSLKFSKINKKKFFANQTTNMLKYFFFSPSSFTHFLTRFNRFNFSHTCTNKVVNSLDEALNGLQDGHTILLGGFGLGGIPENLIRHIGKSKLRNLTMVSSTTCIIFCKVFVFNYWAQLFLPMAVVYLLPTDKWAGLWQAIQENTQFWKKSTVMERLL